MAVKGIWSILTEKKRGEEGKLSDYINWNEASEYITEPRVKQHSQNNRHTRYAIRRA